MLPGETLADVLADYAEVARQTDDLVATLPDLEATRPLPKAPWSEPDALWSARRDAGPPTYRCRGRAGRL